MAGIIGNRKARTLAAGLFKPKPYHKLARSQRKYNCNIVKILSVLIAVLYPHMTLEQTFTTLTFGRFFGAADITPYK
jgi:uncharacterized membrane protein YadS